MAIQALQDRYARLVEGGADIDARIELAELFVDLPVFVPCRGWAPGDDLWAMPTILSGKGARKVGDVEVTPEGTSLPSFDQTSIRWLLVGGPGSGKSTITTMIAQVLRLPWIDPQLALLPERVRDAWRRAREGLLRLAAPWTRSSNVLPLRVNLPALARWMADRNDDPELAVWEYLAAQLVNDLASEGLSTDLSGRQLRAMIEAIGGMVWILDGLDEVPRSAGRDRVIEAVRALACKDAQRVSGMLVATRPQGYEGEFDELDAVVLRPLPLEVAHQYGERLLRAWSNRGASSDLSERLHAMQVAFSKPDVAALLQTPLHTTMAALLVAARGTLPSARSLLFDHYFGTTFRRELGKPFDHGIRPEDEPILRTLHARAGLTLQVRSQEQVGARSSLRRREVRELLAALYAENGFGGDDARANAERMMRFASERLVLLLHSSEGRYEFSVRSLQEFFAAEALLEGEPEVIRLRLDAIVMNPHWSNVLAFIVSRCALEQSKAGRDRALLFTASLCRALNKGELGGEAAARCFMGSRLALSMLLETEHYGNPWLHGPLWEVALEASTAPLQRSSAREGYRRSAARGLVSMWNDDMDMHTRLGLVAAGWSSANAKDYQDKVLNAADASLSSGTDQALVGWHLLYGLLLADAPEARRMAEQHAPGTREDAREVIRAHRDVQLAPWVITFLAHHSELLTPGFVIDSLRRRSLSPNNGDKTILQSVALLLNEHRWISLSWSGECELMIRLMGPSVQAWEEIAREIPEAGPEWRAWKKIAEFLASPSLEALAQVLDASADRAAWVDLLSQRHLLPWPIAACLEFARGPEERRALAKRIRDGHLGTVEDWRAAEARWRSSLSFTQSDIEAWLSVDGLWDKTIASKGAVFLPGPVFEHRESQDLLKILIDWLNSSRAKPEPALALLGSLLEEGNAVPLRIARLAEGDLDGELGIFYFLTSILPDLSGPDAEGWFELLDQRGREGHNASWPYHQPLREHLEWAATTTRALLQRLRERPNQWGLMDALFCMLVVLPDTDLAAMELPSVPDNAPLRAHATRAALSILAGCFQPAELHSLLGSLQLEPSKKEADLRSRLADILGHRTRDRDGATSLLLAALDATPSPARDVRDELLGGLFTQLSRAAPQAFTTLDAWRSHDLPEPFLAKQPPREPPSRMIRIADLSNVRLFKETPTVDIPFPQPAEERGQWIVLVGENGVGKTTLLRALALTLASPSVASKLLDERLPMVRNGGEGRVAMEVGAGLLSVAILRDERERTERVESRSPNDIARPWVVGYGVRRGNARGEKDREPEVGPIGELHTLFDRPASLINAVEWLKELDRQVLREQRQSSKSADSPLGPREAIWKSVVNALRVLLGVTDVEVDDLHVYVKHPRFGRVRLDALSDGYLTTTGWVIDMVARWIDRQRELDEPVGADVLRQMCGFVLIDEIDLHLHPIWQMRIIDDVRRLFPRLSFIVTTHNPLTLQGARRGEVYVMRSDGGRVELVQRDIQPGHDVDRVLFEQFGVEHTFDRETRDLLARHREMVERSVPPDDPERKDIEERLVERFGDVGGTLNTERQDARGASSRLRPEERSLLSPFLKKRD